MTRNVRLEPLLPWSASPHGNRVCLQHHAYVLFYFPHMAWMPRMHCAKHLLMNLLAGWGFCSGPGSLGEPLPLGDWLPQPPHRLRERSFDFC